ncbi:MAG: hypothetical protein ACLFSB_01690 [Chitinispirillaceae bacterium]
MIGDHPDTALAIAKQLGIADKRENLIAGKQLAEFAAAEQEQVSEELGDIQSIKEESRIKKMGHSYDCPIFYHMV